MRMQYATSRLFIILAVAVLGAGPSLGASGAAASPKSGHEGTLITITYPKALPDYPKPLQALIFDPGVHGYYIAHGAGIYVAYDPQVGSKYVVPANAVPHSKKKNAYTAMVPPGVCGIIIKSTQATVSHVPAGVIQGSPTVVGQTLTTYPLKSSAGKALQISLVGEKGSPAKFSLTCDKYTFSVKVKADPTSVEVPGPSVVTATLTVKGPAQVVVGAKLTKPKTQLMLLAPLAFERVRFDTDFGTLAPNPPTPEIDTDTEGHAVVTVTSPDPGTATVRALALGLGDARVKVEFTKKKIVPPDQPVAMVPGPLPPPQPAPVKADDKRPAKEEPSLLESIFSHVSIGVGVGVSEGHRDRRDGDRPLRSDGPMIDKPTTDTPVTQPATDPPPQD